MEILNPEDTFLVDLFNLEPDDVRSIRYESRHPHAIFHIVLAQKNDPCPHCGHTHPKIKNYILKQIRHSALEQRSCLIYYKARRYICPLCHRSYYEYNPFVFNRSRISTMTVIQCLEQLRSFNETFTSVARRNNISPTSVCSIFDQHVHISRKPLPEILNIDEVYAFRSSTSKYICVLLDHLTQTPVDILPDRKFNYLKAYFDAIPEHEKKKVRIVCTDMYETYRSIIHQIFPQVIHAVDHYHMSQELHRKLNAVRIRIMKGYGKEDPGYYVLKKFNWLLFKNRNACDDKGPLFDVERERKYNHHYKRYMNYYDLREEILQTDDSLKEAYRLKNTFDDFYENNDLDSAPKAIQPVIRYFLASSIEEMNAFGNTLIRWKSEIIHSFHIVKKEYHINKEDGHVDIHNKRISNAIIENRNKVIKCIKNNANGYRNWQRYRNRLMYVLDPKQTYYLDPIQEEKENENK